jgi:DNA-binding transcriptional regulator YhcF (GntR family)
MDFKEQQPIYLQIADYISDNILLQKWPVGQRVISIRELAVNLQVNPNTVQRSYEFLQQHGILSNRRGVGYFAEIDAEKKIKKYRKEFFLEKNLPDVFKNMFLLDISLKELETMYRKFVQKKFKATIHED